MAVAGFVLGWKGDEDEEVDISGSDEEAVGIESAAAAADGRMIPTATNKSAASPSIFREKGRELSPVGGKQQRLDNRSREDSRGYKKDAVIAGATSAAARRAENANGTAASIKGKEPALEEEEEAMAVRKRKLESSSLRDLKRRKSSDWRSSQWVACVLCRKWRRIPFELNVERSVWHCKENIWNSSMATCEVPQEEPETFDNVCTMRVDCPNTLCISDGVLRRDSASAKSGAPVADDMAIASETIVGNSTDAADRAAENGTVSMVPLETLTAEGGEAGPTEDVSPCQACGLGGQTISCSLTGCARRYHIACLVPPLTSRPSGGWYCKKHEVESIWLSRAECGDGGGQMYYVKWRGRAHLYDSLLSEVEVLKLAPKKLTHLTKTGKLSERQPSWTVPERVIGKRTNDSQEQCLVKWSRLPYELSTWESTSTGVLLEEKGRTLIDMYERWCEVARLRARAPQTDKVFEKCARLVKQPSWLQSVPLQDHQLEMLNNLRDCWCKQNEGIVLTQEDPVPVVAFSISLFREFQAQQPILVVASPEMLMFWETKLEEWTPDLNVVMFYGSQTSRDFIKQHEFSLIEGCVKLHIVVTTLDVVGSDAEFLQGFKWSSLLIHDSRRARKSIFESLAKLSSSFRFLFHPEPWKWDAEERQLIAAIFRKSENIDWKELVACEYNAEPVNDLREYWVPAQMSPVQVHQYCLLLVKYFELLRSGNMCQGDLVLQDLLSVLRNCCSHPYLVSETVQKDIEKAFPAAEWLNVGITVSGKLELMHKMLSQFHLNKIKTVIIVQSARPNKLMDIIDDYLRQKFPGGSYGRVERGMDAKSRHAALTRFKSQDSGCFALLLERGAAISIPNQLTGVGTVLIYDSDWNPWSDTMCIRKLGLNSVSLYRLYSRLTLEEKILDGARQDVVPNERPLKHLSVKVIQEILRWGAAALLQMDDWGMQNSSATDPRIRWDSAANPDEIGQQLFLLDDDEVKAVALGNHGPSLNDKLRTILSARDASSKSVLLYGVSSNACDSTAADEFWSPLLKDKRDKSLQIQGQRTRKPVEYRDSEVLSKRKKRKLTPPSQQATHGELRDVDASDRVPPTKGAGADASSPQVVATPVSQSSGGRATTSSGQRQEQLERLNSLQTELKSLAELLELPENVLDRAQELLSIVAANLRLDNNFIPEVELSLCWIAAEQMDVDFDKMVATSAATSEGFDVDEQSLEVVYNKLKRTLPAFFSEQNKARSSTVAATESTQASVQVSPRAWLDSPRDSGGCSVQVTADSVEKRDLLEEKRQELKRRRNAETQRLLNSQKRAWDDFLKTENREKKRLGEVYEAECQNIQALDTAESNRLLAKKTEEHNLRLKEFQARMENTRKELGHKQMIRRKWIAGIFAAELEELDKGVLVDTDPATDCTAELREGQRESSANLGHQEQQLPRGNDDPVHGDPPGVRQQQSPREQSRADQSQSLPGIQSGELPARPQVSSVSMSTAAAARPVLPVASIPAPGNGSSTREEVPLEVTVPAPASRREEALLPRVPASRSQEVPVPNVPARKREEPPLPEVSASRSEEAPILNVPANRREAVPCPGIPASRREQTPPVREASIAASRREEVESIGRKPPIVEEIPAPAPVPAPAPAPAPVPRSGREEVPAIRPPNEEVPLPARRVEVVSDVPVPPPASRSQVLPGMTASRGRQEVAPAFPVTGSRPAVVIALPANRGQQEVPRTITTTPTAGRVNEISAGNRSQPLVALPATAEAPLALGQSPRVPQQQASNSVPPAARLPTFVDPLALEESRLQKEMDKIKKAHDDEVTRLTKELEALTRKLEDECKAFEQKADALKSNISKVGGQRRLSEVLRLKDTVRFHAFRSPATGWHNSVMDLAAIAGSNSRPQALAGSSSAMAALYNAQHGLLRIPAQHFSQLPQPQHQHQHHPQQQQQQQQQVMLFPMPSSPNAARDHHLRPVSPSFTTPATQQTHHHPHPHQGSSSRHQFMPVSGSLTPVGLVIPNPLAPAATPPPTVVSTTQELMNARASSQMMYRTIGENLRLSCLNPLASTGIGGGSNAGGNASSSTGIVGAAAVVVPGSGTGNLAGVAAQTGASPVVSPALARAAVGDNAFIAQHPLESPASLGHADYICLSDEE